ncbi:unnamed protein product [Echinostoma caproni]|uniref:Proteasome assembly chaperone 3 n=1 Tax=Echinostoma caproni TaxID=27848 RepID=A0A183B761_9TREM|nr:unnamed protein product [Echinostoma caproni]
MWTEEVSLAGDLDKPVLRQISIRKQDNANNSLLIFKQLLGGFPGVQLECDTRGGYPTRLPIVLILQDGRYRVSYGDSGYGILGVEVPSSVIDQSASFVACCLRRAGSQQPILLVSLCESTVDRKKHAQVVLELADHIQASLR